MGMTKDVQHFLDNPNELDLHDPETMSALMKEAGATAAEPVKAEPEKTETTEPAKAAEPEPKPEPIAEPVKPEDPKGVLAPDGKSIIPYKVLSDERTARQTANEALDEMSRQVVALTKRLEAVESGKADPGATDTSAVDDLDAQIAALEEEAPALAETMRRITQSTRDHAAKLEQRLADMENERDSEAKAMSEKVNANVNAAIDANPTLVEWRANDAERWESAKAIDSVLKTKPQWADRPFADRFEKVVQMVRAEFGDASPEVKPEKPSAPKAGNAAAIKQAAEEKLKDASPTVTTLSDVPGGAKPEQTEDEQIENISILQLGAQFEKMTPQQQANYLARFQ
jgi:hypothetical protein